MSWQRSRPGFGFVVLGLLAGSAHACSPDAVGMGLSPPLADARGSGGREGTEDARDGEADADMAGNEGTGSAGGDGESPAETGAAGSLDASSPEAGRETGSAVGERHVLFVWGQDGQAASRDGMRALLESMKTSHGVIVDELEDSKTTAASTVGKALVIINPTTKAYSGSVQGKFRDVPVPVIISKDHVQQDMNVASGTNDHSDADKTQITIVADGDPLAAGLTGTVTVYPEQSRLIFAENPGPEAKRIAIVPGLPDQVCIYAFARGAVMAGGFKAPAKRAGFFWHRPTDTTAEGKMLLRALVAWALEP
jgi:hypothetical protein